MKTRLSISRTGTDGKKTKYAYGRNGAVIVERTGNNTRSYIYANGVIAGFVDTNGEKSETRYCVTDHQGSVEKIVDGTSSVLWASCYTAFGIKGDEIVNRIEFTGMFTGKDIDPETGLTYHWNRWRSEDGSVWLSEDPARDGTNWYGYCGNNPVMFVDLNGLDYKGMPSNVQAQLGLPPNPTPKRDPSPKVEEPAENTPTNNNLLDLDQYVEKINDAKLAEIIQLQKDMGYDFDVMGLDQKTVGERLGINGKAACLVTIWMKMYVLEGATVDKAYSVMENEIKAGRISKDQSYMKDQLMTSENLAKALKGKNYDKLFLQSPWKNKKQVTYNSIEDFRKSDYKYAFIRYSSLNSEEFHYTLLINTNGYLLEHDPYPGGINSLDAWEEEYVTLESIEPKGWYKR